MTAPATIPKRPSGTVSPRGTSTAMKSKSPKVFPPPDGEGGGGGLRRHDEDGGGGGVLRREEDGHGLFEHWLPQVYGNRLMVFPPPSEQHE